MVEDGVAEGAGDVGVVDAAKVREFGCSEVEAASVEEDAAPLVVYLPEASSVASGFSPWNEVTVAVHVTENHSSTL